MKYRVDVKEISYGTIIVDAVSEEEAYEKAETAYTMGNTIWNSGEYEITDAKRIPDRSRDAR